jgi:glycosyltransferase involved in cell wall biosynthesis
LEEKRRFLMFGRLVPDKGYDEYIQAARVLSGKYGERVKFSILGMPDRTRTQAEALFERIKDAAREGVVTYLEPCDEVEEVLSEVDCVVLPSLYNEGVPRSLLEGLGSAKVIVTTDWKGCRDTVIDDENGYLVPVGSNGSGKVLVEALCDKLEQVVELSRDRLLKMQRASRQLAENRFDEQQVIGEYLAKINSFLEWDAKEVAGTDRQLVV